MTELFDSLTRGYLGKRLIKALSLPVPAPLLRPSEIRFSNQKTLQGHIILSGFAPDDLFKTCMQALIAENSSHHIDPKLHWHGATSAQSQLLINTHGLQTLPSHLPPNSRGTFSALILNTQSYRSPQAIDQLYTDCKALLPLLDKRGHAILLSPIDEQSNPTSKTSGITNLFLEGFTSLVKCLAKEIASEAITINHLMVNPQQLSAIPTLLDYLLSHRSCYVTGQALTVGDSVTEHKWPLRARQANVKSPLERTPANQPLALLTGAGGCIGRAITHKLAANGFKLILADRTQKQFVLRDLAEQTGGTPLTLDLTRPNSIAILSDCIDEHGGQLHALIHNAGITQDRLFKNMTPEAWQNVLDINLWAPAEITQFLLKDKKIADHGRIVLMSSVVALSGNRGQSQYCFSKAGLIGLMRDLLPTIAKSGITINAIAPGFIDTPMTRKIPGHIREFTKRLNAFAQPGHAEDVAEAVSLCCDPTAEHFTGNILRVCGLMPCGR